MQLNQLEKRRMDANTEWESMGDGEERRYEEDTVFEGDHV